MIFQINATYFNYAASQKFLDLVTVAILPIIYARITLEKINLIK